MSDDPYGLGPKPSFVEAADYQGIWRRQSVFIESRYSRAGLMSESGEDPDELLRMPYWQYLKTRHWDLVRRRALAVAEGKCFYCGITEHLDVHHLTYRRRGCELDEDLMVLCRTCHDAEHEAQDEVEEIRRRAELARQRIA